MSLDEPAVAEVQTAIEKGSAEAKHGGGLDEWHHFSPIGVSQRGQLNHKFPQLNEVFGSRLHGVTPLTVQDSKKSPKDSTCCCSALARYPWDMT